MSGYRDDHRFAKALSEGVKFYKLGLYYEAIECFEYALKVDPENAYIYLQIASCFRKLGFLDKALEYLEKARELDRDIRYMPMTLTKLVSASLNLGNTMKP